MNDAFYTRMAATALRLVKAKGQAVNFRRFGGTFDPVEGATTDVAFDDGQLYAVSLPISSSPQGMADKLKDILTVDKMRYLLAVMQPGSTLANPVVGDIVFLEQEYWKLVVLQALNPAGITLIYHLILSKEALSAEQLAAMDLEPLEEAVAGLEEFVES